MGANREGQVVKTVVQTRIDVISICTYMKIEAKLNNGKESPCIAIHSDPIAISISEVSHLCMRINSFLTTSLRIPDPRQQQQRLCSVRGFPVSYMRRRMSPRVAVFGSIVGRHFSLAAQSKTEGKQCVESSLNYLGRFGQVI